MKNVLLSLLCLMMAVVAQAGNIKIKKTEVNSFGMDASGVFFNAEVTVQADQIGKEKWALVVLMDNNKWDENISGAKLSQLASKICYAEIAIPSDTRGLKTFTVSVPLDEHRVTGTGKILYIKAYVVNLTKSLLADQGTFLPYTPKAEHMKNQLIRQQMQSLAEMGATLKALGIAKSGGSGGSGKGTRCHYCSGSGTCHYCDGSGKYPNGENCACGGTGKCGHCNGSGYE